MHGVDRVPDDEDAIVQPDLDPVFWYHEVPISLAGEALFGTLTAFLVFFKPLAPGTAEWMISVVIVESCSVPECSKEVGEHTGTADGNEAGSVLVDLGQLGMDGLHNQLEIGGAEMTACFPLLADCSAVLDCILAVALACLCPHTKAKAVAVPQEANAVFALDQQDRLGQEIEEAEGVSTVGLELLRRRECCKSKMIRSALECNE